MMSPSEGFVGEGTCRVVRVAGSCPVEFSQSVIGKR